MRFSPDSDADVPLHTVEHIQGWGCARLRIVGGWLYRNHTGLHFQPDHFDPGQPCAAGCIHTPEPPAPDAAGESRSVYALSDVGRAVGQRLMDGIRAAGSATLPAAGAAGCHSVPATPFTILPLDALASRETPITYAPGDFTAHFDAEMAAPIPAPIVSEPRVPEALVITRAGDGWALFDAAHLTDGTDPADLPVGLAYEVATDGSALLAAIDNWTDVRRAP